MTNPLKNFDKDAFQQKLKDKMSDSMQNAKSSTARVGPLQWAAIVVCVLCIGGMVGSFLNMTNQQDAYTVSYEDNVSTISQLKAEISQYQNAELPTPDELEVSVTSAYEKGARVAYFQTTYFSLDVVNQQDAWRENLVALAPYFDENTGKGQEKWFSPDRTANYTKLTWQFVSDVTSAADEFPVVWLLRDESDSLVAFTTGMYHTDSGLFSDIEVIVTSYGETNYMDTSSDGTGPTDSGPLETYDPVSIPNGYHVEINDDGSTSVVDANGNPYEGDLDGTILGEGGLGSNATFQEEFEAAVNGRVNGLDVGGDSE